MLYLIKNGTADINVKNVGKVATLINGMAFGERAILNEGEVRTATVTAISNMVCYTLGRKECQALLGNVTEVRLIRVLQQVPILKALNNQQLYGMSKLLTLVEYKANDFVFRKGDIGDAFYIVESGLFVAKVRSGRNRKRVEMGVE
jgi:CRP-like cAMP-binding protein